MKLTKTDTKKIAELARLELTDEELITYGEQMSQVFDYMEELKEVDVANTEPTAQVTGLQNIIRADEVQVWPQDEIEKSLAQAPTREGDYIKVKRIL